VGAIADLDSTGHMPLPVLKTA